MKTNRLRSLDTSYELLDAEIITGPEVDNVAGVIERALDDAVREAVAAEREACAVAVEDTDIVRMGRGYMECDDAQGTRNAAAATIRARGGKQDAPQVIDLGAALKKSMECK